MTTLLSDSPSLSTYKKGDKVQVKVTNNRTGLIEFRDAVVTETGIVYAKYGAKHPPYPFIQVDTIFTYWRKGENGKDEFYDKENSTRYYYSTDVKKM